MTLMQQVHDEGRETDARTRRFVAVTEEIEQVLGYLCFYSLPEVYVSYETLRAAWIGAGLSAALLPREPSAEGLFQRAVRRLETRRAGAERRVEIKVAEVARSEAEVVYQVNFLVRLTGRRVVEHPKALRLTLHRKVRAIAAVGLGDGVPLHDADGDEIALPDTGELVRKVRAHFREHDGQVHSDTLRRMVREQLRLVNAQAVRESGGVWFVPRQVREVVRGLGQVVRAVGGPGAEWHWIPLADDAEQKAMVRRHLVANCTRVVERQIGEARGLLAAGGGCDQRQLAAFVTEQRRVRALVREYQALLEDELGEVEAQMQVLARQIAALVLGPGQEPLAAGDPGA